MAGVVDEVKTKYSRAGLPLDPALAELLWSWKAKTPVCRSWWPNCWRETSSCGKPWSRQSEPDLLSPTRDSCYSGTPLRTRHTALLALTLIAAASFAQAPATPQEKLPLWAYPGHFSPAPSSPAVRAEVEHLPGSKATYTKGEIGDLFVVPDWYPDAHPPMPDSTPLASTSRPVN